MITCFAALLLQVGQPLANGDFEATTSTGAIPHWTLEVGARNGGTDAASRVDLDTSVRHGGQASLHFSGDDKVRTWLAASQEFEGRPGATYTLGAFAKTLNVRSEKGQGTNVQQYSNAYVAIFLRSADGQIVAKDYARATLPTADWEKVTAKVTAPETTRSAEVYVFLSMSGDMWVDDLDLDVAGGKALPPPELVLSEGFENATTMPAQWNEVLGASNAPGGPRSLIALDPDVGESGSPRSLHLSGDGSTTKWFQCVREFEALPGDTFYLAASFKTKDVRKEGLQFPNLHMGLAFRGMDGRSLGSAVYASGPLGTNDWKRVEARALAPEGTTKVELSAFLSMSGDAWIDRIELKRRGGGTPAYGDWMTMDSQHVLVRYPKDHPRRSDMRAYAARLDAAYEAIRTKLGIDFNDKVTVFLYVSDEQGRRFTGRTLAFAAPEDRTVHQKIDNTIGHELVHVLALAVGYAQVPLFGEGLAVWLDGETEQSHHDRAAQLLRDQKLPSLENLLAHFRADEAVTYPAAGSFVGFVIETCGIDALKRIYLAPDPVASAPVTLGHGLDELDQMWRGFLASRK